MTAGAAPKRADSMQAPKKQVNGVSRPLRVREDVEIFPAFQIEPGAGPEKSKAIFGDLGAALAFQHFIESVTNTVQV